MAEWKTDSIKPLCQLQFEGPWPMAVAVCGDTRKVVAGNQDGLLLAWDIPTDLPAPKVDEKEKKPSDEPRYAELTPSRSLVGHTNGVTNLVATPDGRTAISSSLDRTLRVWDMTAASSGSAEVILDRRQRERALKKLPEAKRKEAVPAPGIKLPTQTAAAELPGHADWINALAITNDGRRAISGDDAGRVIVWDVATRKEVSRWQCPGVAWVSAVALSPDGQTALVAQYRRKGGDFNNYPAGLRLFNVADGAITLDLLAKMFPKEKNPAYQYQYEYHKIIGEGLVTAQFSPDGKLFAIGQGGEGGEAKIHLFEPATGKLVRSLPGHQYGNTQVRFTADGKNLISVGRDTMLRVQDLEGKELAKLGKPRGGQFTDWLSAVSVSADEKLLAATDISGFVQLWQVG